MYEPRYSDGRDCDCTVEQSKQHTCTKINSSLDAAEFIAAQKGMTAKELIDSDLKAMRESGARPLDAPTIDDMEEEAARRADLTQVDRYIEDVLADRIRPSVTEYALIRKIVELQKISDRRLEVINKIGALVVTTSILSWPRLNQIGDVCEQELKESQNDG